MRQEQETEADRGFDISGGELAERFIFAAVTGIGIAAGALLLSSIFAVLTGNRPSQQGTETALGTTLGSPGTRIIDDRSTTR